jgi:hypothetical protein
MGEKAENHTAADRGYGLNREDAHLDSGVIVPGGGYKGQETPTLEQGTMTDSSVRDRIRVKPGPSYHEPTGYSPLLKRISELYIAREVFRAEVEKVREQKRLRAERWRKKHPQTHKARVLEATHKRRALEKQQAESA